MLQKLFTTKRFDICKITGTLSPLWTSDIFQVTFWHLWNKMPFLHRRSFQRLSLDAANSYSCFVRGTILRCSPAPSPVMIAYISHSNNAGFIISDSGVERLVTVCDWGLGLIYDV